MSSHEPIFDEDLRRKEESVIGRLWNYVSSRRLDVESLQYRRVLKLDREVVIVHFTDGTMLNVNVTGASEEAIAEEVLAAIEAED